MIGELRNERVLVLDLTCDIFTEKEYSRMNDSEKLFHVNSIVAKDGGISLSQYAKEHDREFYDRYRILFD